MFSHREVCRPFSLFLSSIFGFSSFSLPPQSFDTRSSVPHLSTMFFIRLLQIRMGFIFSKLMRNFVILYIMFSGVQYLLKWKSYTISPKEFKSIASKSQGPSPAAAVNRLATDLHRVYGNAITPNTEWHALPLGGIGLQALFLHASVTEYVAVFGTPFNTAGRIGMHWSNSTCTVLTGSVFRSKDNGNLAEKETFSAGGNFRHGQFESYQYLLSDDTYVACYGRGMMPVSGLWVVTGSVAQGEPLSLAKLTYSYGQGTFNHVYMALAKTFNYYKNKATGSKTEL